MLLLQALTMHSCNLSSLNGKTESVLVWHSRLFLYPLLCMHITFLVALMLSILHKLPIIFDFRYECLLPVLCLEEAAVCMG